MKNKQGFTLLELLMVVIIIAILAAIALPQYFKAAERSRAAEALQVLATMRGAQARYKAADPLQAYSTDPTLLDVEIPGVGKVPASTIWAYDVTPPLGTATRAGTGATIQTMYDTGTLCTSDAPTYNLPTGC